MKKATLKRNQVYSLIDGERDYQEEQKIKNGWNSTHNVGEFLVMLDSYVRKAQDTWCTDSDDNAANTTAIIRKIAALSVACMEENGAPPRG